MENFTQDQLKALADEFAAVRKVFTQKTPSPAELKEELLQWLCAKNVNIGIQDINALHREVQCRVSVWIKLGESAA